MVVGHGGKGRMGGPGCVGRKTAATTGRRRFCQGIVFRARFGIAAAAVPTAVIVLLAARVTAVRAGRTALNVQLTVAVTVATAAAAG